MASPPKSLGNLADFPPSGLREVELAGTKILLIRQAGKTDQVTAIAGTCPHAGAPLAQGVLHNGTVICPWHKAAFAAGTGKCLEPPAVDNVAPYKIHVIDGEIFLGARDEDVPPRKSGLDGPSLEDQRRFVIIGAGGAGFSAAQELRRQHFAGQILLLDATCALPYDRTIQSKYVLSGAAAGEKSPLQDEEFYRRQNIERRQALVQKLDAATQTITLQGGEALHYDAALIATGAAPMPLPFPGAGLANVFVLRSKQDAAQIVAAAAAARRAVVIGTSFIGMEAAAALRERGLDVTVIGQDTAPFEKTLGAEIGRVFQRLHQSKGVKFELGVKVENLGGARAVSTVTLANGKILPADLVIAGLGVKPATDFVSGVTRDKNGGLIAQADLKIARNLYAAGDVAVFPARGDGAKIRVEHWRVAEQQGRLAARAMLGDSVIYDAVPVFWTIQYMNRLDYIGHAAADHDIVIRGSLEDQDFIAYYLKDDIVKAAAGMNRDADMAAILALMTAQRAWRLPDLHPPHATPQAVLNHREGRL